MARKVNYGKILAVLFLTILIWVWADQQKTEEFIIADAIVSITTPSDPKLWVSFPQGSTASIEEILVKGATSRIDKLRKKIRAGERLIFDLDTAEEEMREKGDHTLLFLPFLNRHIQREFGLKVEACLPEKIAMHVRTLTEKTMEVSCFDQSGNPVKANIDPAKVDMFVPEDIAPVAKVILTNDEIEQARTTPISRRPFFEFGPGQRISADISVEIATPPRGLTPETIDNPRLGYTLSGNLKGKFEPVINEDSMVYVISPIRIKATTEAKQAYESSLYHFALEIKDGDEKLTEGIRRVLTYNFPDEYLSKNQIELNQTPVEVQFKLIRLPDVSATPAPGS